MPLYQPASLPNNPHSVVHVHESFFLFAQHLHPLAGVRGISRLNSNGEKYSKIKNKVIEEKQFYVNQYLTSGIDH